MHFSVSHPDHFGTFKAATHHIVQQLTQAGPLVTKQTCDWLPQPPNCSQMHFSSNTKPPSQSYLPSLASRTGIWSPASGTLLPPPPSLDNEKSSPQISSQLEQSFRLSPLIFLPGSHSRGSGNQPRKPSTVSSGMPLSPQPHRYRTRPSGLALSQSFKPKR